jgi:hypothetical protein
MKKTKLTDLCECGYKLATEIDEGHGELCLECWIMWDYAMNRFGMSAEEYAAVPVKQRLGFLIDRFNAAVLSGEPTHPEVAREICHMLDSIKKARTVAGFPSVSR